MFLGYLNPGGTVYHANSDGESSLFQTLSLPCFKEKARPNLVKGNLKVYSCWVLVGILNWEFL